MKKKIKRKIKRKAKVFVVGSVYPIFVDLLFGESDVEMLRHCIKGGLDCLRHTGLGQPSNKAGFSLVFVTVLIWVATTMLGVSLSFKLTAMNFCEVSISCFLNVPSCGMCSASNWAALEQRVFALRNCSRMALDAAKNMSVFLRGMFP